MFSIDTRSFAKCTDLHSLTDSTNCVDPNLKKSKCSPQVWLNAIASFSWIAYKKPGINHNPLAPSPRNEASIVLVAGLPAKPTPGDSKHLFLPLTLVGCFGSMACEMPHSIETANQRTSQIESFAIHAIDIPASWRRSIRRPRVDRAISLSSSQEISRSVLRRFRE